jgi:hypothetical protein
MKRLLIVVSGTGAQHDLEIQPGTTAADILTELGLHGYTLRSEPNSDAFGSDENVFTSLKDGQKIFAVSRAEVGISVG